MYIYIICIYIHIIRLMACGVVILVLLVITSNQASTAALSQEKMPDLSKATAPDAGRHVDGLLVRRLGLTQQLSDEFTKDETTEARGNQHDDGGESIPCGHGGRSRRRRGFVLLRRSYIHRNAR